MDKEYNFVQIFEMTTKRYSERKILLFTAGLILFSGLVRLKSYPVGIVLFYLSFLPFMVYRLNYFFRNRKMGLPTNDRYRMVVLTLMLLTIVFNIAGWQEADFFLLFLLMIDFLLVVNQKI